MPDNDAKDSPRPLSTTGVGSMILADSDGNLTVGKSAREWFQLTSARSASVTAVPNYPRYHVPDLPSDVVSDMITGYARVGWAMLRKFREQNPLCKLIMASRHRTALQHAIIHDGRKTTVGFKTLHQDHYRAGVKPPSYIEPYIRMADELLRSPAPGDRAPTLGDLVVPLVEDLLVINRPVIEVLTSRDDPKQVAGIRPVDGALILERAQYVRFWLSEAKVKEQSEIIKRQVNHYIDRPAEDAATFVSEQTKHNIANAEYVLVRDGIVEGTYSPGRLYTNPMRTRTDILYTPYQPSAVEDAMEILSAFWETWDRENIVFREGSWADTLLMFEGIDNGEFNNFLQQIREAGQGYHRSHKPIMVRGMEASKVHKIDLKPPPNEMQFMQRVIMTANMVCSIFQEHPSSINFPEFQGGARSPLNERDRSDEIDAAKSAGHKTDLTLIANLLTKIVRDKIHPELIVVCNFGDYDAMSQARLHEVRVKSTHTRNELRVADGERPHGFYLSPDDYDKASDEKKAKHDQNPWNQPDSAVFMQQAQALSMASQMGQGQTTEDGVPAQACASAGAGKGDVAGASQRPVAAPKEALSKGPRQRDLFIASNVDDWQTY